MKAVEAVRGFLRRLGRSRDVELWMREDVATVAREWLPTKCRTDSNGSGKNASASASTMTGASAASGSGSGSGTGSGKGVAGLSSPRLAGNTTPNPSAPTRPSSVNSSTLAPVAVTADAPVTMVSRLLPYLDVSVIAGGFAHAEFLLRLLREFVECRYTPEPIVVTVTSTLRHRDVVTVSLSPRPESCLDWQEDWVDSAFAVQRAQDSMLASGVLPTVVKIMEQRAGSFNHVTHTHDPLYMQAMLVTVSMLLGGNNAVQRDVLQVLAVSGVDGGDGDGDVVAAPLLHTVVDRVMGTQQWWQHAASDRAAVVGTAAWRSNWTVDMALSPSARTELRFLQSVCEHHNPQLQVK